MCPSKPILCHCISGRAQTKIMLTNERIHSFIFSAITFILVFISIIMQYLIWIYINYCDKYKNHK
jgi:hypothetical protein